MSFNNRRYLFSVLAVLLSVFVSAFSQTSLSDDWYYNKPIKLIHFQNLKTVKHGDLDGITSSFISKPFTDDLVSELYDRLFSIDYFDDIEVKATKNNSTLTVQLAINYGGWDEIARAANKAINAGITSFTPETLLSFVDNPSVPLPDMIVRSAGEERLSGFLLLQSNYSEFGFYDKLWPDWDEEMVDTILSDFQSRTRKYGGLTK